MKKQAAILLALMMLLLMSACGQAPDRELGVEQQQESNAEEAAEEKQRMTRQVRPRRKRSRLLKSLLIQKFQKQPARTSSFMSLRRQTASPML